MKRVSIPRFATQFITYAMMDKNRVFNGIVKRISAGKVTRDRLAKSIISNTLSLGQQHVSSHQMLGRRSAEIVNQVRSVLFDNTQQQIKDGIAPLIEVILKSKGQGEFAQKMAAGIAQFVGPSLLQNNALERVLVALTEQNGGENALKLALDNALGGVTGGKIVSATFMSALKRAILDNPDYKPTSYLHHVIAWKLHQSLATDPTTLPPSPMGLQTVETIAGKIPGLVTAVCRQLDTLQKFLQLPLSEKELSSVFTECWPSDLTVSDATSSKEFIKLAMMAHATDQHHVLDNSIALLSKSSEKRGNAFQRQYAEIKNFLAKMPTSEIKVTQNWSGEIEAISTHHVKEHNPSSRLEDFMASAFRVSVHHPEAVNAYFTDSAFIEAFKSGIDLNIDNSHQSYSRWVSGFGNQLLSQAKQICGGQPGLSGTQLRQLGQLSDMVDNNPLSLLALTRYLNPTNIINAVQYEVFNQFLRPTSQAALASEPVIIGADKLWMSVGKPEVGFTVNKKNGVNIAIAVQWPVSEFSTQQDDVRRGHNMVVGENASPTAEAGHRSNIMASSYQKGGHISTELNVNMQFNERGLDKQTMSIGSTTISLREQLTFAPPQLLTGATAKPISVHTSNPAHIDLKRIEKGPRNKGAEIFILQGASKLASSC